MKNPKIIDLTKRLNDRLDIYNDGAYRDPPLKIETWCTVSSQRFWVSTLQMGTQTGTHIDAPAHFVEGGAMLEVLDVAQLIGPYFFVPVEALTDLPLQGPLLNKYNDEKILFLHAMAVHTLLPEPTFRALLALDCPVWVTSIGITIVERDPLYFHQVLAENGRFLIEDLDHNAAMHVQPGGTLIALPLRLEGVSGSPCRVIVQNLTAG